MKCFRGNSSPQTEKASGFVQFTTHRCFCMAATALKESSQDHQVDTLRPQNRVGSKSRCAVGSVPNFCHTLLSLLKGSSSQEEIWWVFLVSDQRGFIFYGLYKELVTVTSLMMTSGTKPHNFFLRNTMKNKGFTLGLAAFFFPQVTHKADFAIVIFVFNSGSWITRAIIFFGAH